MDTYHDMIRSLPDDQLMATSRRFRRIILTLTVALPASVLGGVWVDWRFIPTAVVALVLLVVFSFGFNGAQDEIVRRNKERSPR